MAELELTAEERASVETAIAHMERRLRLLTEGDAPPAEPAVEFRPAELWADRGGIA
jgi:hypothetical protein